MLDGLCSSILDLCRFCCGNYCCDETSKLCEEVIKMSTIEQQTQVFMAQILWGVHGEMFLVFCAVYNLPDDPIDTDAE